MTWAASTWLRLPLTVAPQLQRTAAGLALLVVGLVVVWHGSSGIFNYDDVGYVYDRATQTGTHIEGNGDAISDLTERSAPAAPSDPLASTESIVAAGGAGDTTRVGRWMSKKEYETMRKSGQAHEGTGGVTSVARPANPAAYERQAASGSRYVEFDVPTGSLRPGGREDWAVIPGPNSIFNRQTGQFPEFPSATCISWLACRR